jgi:hypothetical protein
MSETQIANELSLEPVWLSAFSEHVSEHVVKAN